MTPKTPCRPAAAWVHAVAGYSTVVSARASPTSPFAASPSALAVSSPLQRMKLGDPGEDDGRPRTPCGLFAASATPYRSVGRSAQRRLRSSKRRTGVACEIPSVSSAQPSPGGIVKRGANCRSGLHHDRFVTDRSAMCLASAHLSIAEREPDKEEYLNRGNLAYQEEVARACGLALDKRILMFKSEPPRSEGDEYRTTFSRPVRPNRPAASIRRRILRTPERVLDAPGMVDDYYLNLLDWSCRNMLAVGLDRSVYLWNADSGDVLPLCTSTSPEPITSLRWVADGSHLAIGTYEGDTQIWDVGAQAKVRSMTGHQARVGVLAWNEHILSSGCRDGSIHNHDVRVAQHRVAELLSHTGEVCGLAWKSDGHQLASGANDNLINIWDVSSSLPRFTKSDHTAAVKALAWCPWQSNLLASGGGSYDRRIHFWNTTTSARISSVDAGSQVTSLVWSREHREILSSHGYPDNNISIWAYPSLVKVADIPAHESRVLHTAASPDGQTVATTASDENLKFWRCFESDPSKAKASKGTSSFSRSKSASRAGTGSRGDAAAAAKRGNSASRMLR